MATKCKLVVVAVLAFTALAANDSAASLVVAREVMEAFGETLEEEEEEQPLLKDAELHMSAVMASKGDLVADLANRFFQRSPNIPSSKHLEMQCAHTCAMQ